MKTSLPTCKDCQHSLFGKDKCYCKALEIYVDKNSTFLTAYDCSEYENVNGFDFLEWEKKKKIFQKLYPNLKYFFMDNTCLVYAIEEEKEFGYEIDIMKMELSSPEKIEVLRKIDFETNPEEILLEYMSMP